MKKATISDDVENLNICALCLLDRKLTDWQRHKVEQIYDLSNELEDGEPEDETS